jgi:hypothetical protein
MENIKECSMKAVVIIMLILFYCSCGQKGEKAVSGSSQLATPGASYAPFDYLEWTESENGLRISKKIEKIQFQLQYMPAEYMTVKYYKDSLDQLDETKFTGRRKEYEGLQYFKLRISIDDFNNEIIKYNSSDNNDYEDRVKYYSFGMQHRLKLIDGNDTLPCVLYNYERTFNLTPNSNFQLAFPASGNISSKTLMIDDKYLGTGKVMMTLTEERIKSIPAIAF